MLTVFFSHSTPDTENQVPPTSHDSSAHRHSVQFLLQASEESISSQENIPTIHRDQTIPRPHAGFGADRLSVQFLLQAPESSPLSPNYSKVDHYLIEPNNKVATNHDASRSEEADEENEIELSQDHAPISLSPRQENIIDNTIALDLDPVTLKLTRSFETKKKIEKIFVSQTQTWQVLAQEFKRKFYLETWDLNPPCTLQNSLLSDKKIKGMAANDLFSVIIYEDESIVEIRKKQTTSQSALLDFSTPTYVFNHNNLPVLIDITDSISLNDHLLGVGLHSGKVLVFDLKEMVCRHILTPHKDCVATLHVNSNCVISAAIDRFVYYSNLASPQSYPQRIGSLRTTVCALSMRGSRVYLGDKRGNIQVWDLEKNLSIYQISISKLPIVDFIPDNNGFFVASTEALIYFEGPEFKQILIHDAFESPITTLTKMDNFMVVGTTAGKIFEFTSTQ